MEYHRSQNALSYALKQVKESPLSLNFTLMYLYKSEKKAIFVEKILCKDTILPKRMTKQEALELQTELIAMLSEKEKAKVLECMRTRNLAKNEIIYKEGDTPQDLLCLIKGKVKIFIDGVGGRCQIVRVIDEIEYFGYRAAFSGEKFLTSAAALEPSRLICIPLTVVRSLLEENARLAWFFLHKLAVALGKSDERTVNLTQKHICARLADSILYLRDRYGLETDGCTLRIQMSRDDMASLSNMTTNNAIRTLSLLAKDKVVAINGRNIKILDEEKLKRISKMG